MRPLTRRSFLKGTAAAGAAAIAPGAPVEAAMPAISGTFRFSRSERATIEAVADTFIVPRGAEDPGGAGLGTFTYVARLLEGSLDDALGHVYAGGPVRADLPGFTRASELPVAKRMRWRATIRRDRGVYRAGIAELNARAGPDGFASLPVTARASLLRAAESGALGAGLQRFFETAFAHTMEAAYAHPVYGGNRHGAAWKRIGFPGDRFDRPGAGRTWGYSHRDIGRPG